MDGYVTSKDGRWYAVIYEGLDPTTGRERRRWHPAGPDRTTAEALARQLAAAERERRGNGRARLTFAGHVHRHWLPRKTRLLRPTTLEGYRRLLDLHILPALGDLPLRAVRTETIEDLYVQLQQGGRCDDRDGVSRHVR